MKVRVSLLSLAMTNLLAGTAVSPMLPLMSEAFINEGGETFAKLFLTLPSLIVIPFLLIAGMLSLLINKKDLIIVGLALYVISGIGGIFAYNDVLMLFFRAISGIGAGLVMPYSSLLIADYFEGSKRNKVLSEAGIIGSIFGMVVLIVTGFLVSIYWRLGFLVFLIALIPLFLIHRNIKPVQNGSNKRRYALIFYFNFRPYVLQLTLACFCMALLTFTYFSNVAFVIVENNIGGAVEAAYAQSFYLIGATIANLLMIFGKKISIPISFITKLFFIAVGFLVIGIMETTIYNIYLGSFFFGLGYGGLIVFFTMLITDHTSRVNRINALSLLTAAMYLGQFVSPLLFKEFIEIFNLKGSTDVFLVVGITIFSAVLFIVWSTIKEKMRKSSNAVSSTLNK